MTRVCVCASVISTLRSVSGHATVLHSAAGSLRPHCNRSAAAMSRRKVSLKDLGAVDHQGWLLRRKEGRSLLGNRWKKYWFVLKSSSLYWYADRTAEKAEGFINLSGFTIEQAKQCKKKHAITARHPLVVTIFVATETFTDMNKWISKLSEAAESCDLVNTEECYSEGSDQDPDESICSFVDPKPETSELENDHTLHPFRESPCRASVPPGLTGEKRRRSSSDGATLETRRTATVGGHRLSWVDHPDQGGAGGGASHFRDEVVHEKPPDEVEHLYKHLEAAHLCQTGQSGQKDLRTSFMRRCRNDKVNEKVHQLRILSSTLKAKESTLLAVDEILNHPNLTAPTYRKWRRSNSIVLQEIGQRNQGAGGDTHKHKVQSCPPGVC